MRPVPPPQPHALKGNAVTLSRGPEGPVHTAAEQWHWPVEVEIVEPPSAIARPRQTAFARRPGVATREHHSVPKARVRAQRLKRQVLGHLWRMELSLAGEHEAPQQARPVSLRGVPVE